jgi:hypothetical protein
MSTLREKINNPNTRAFLFVLIIFAAVAAAYLFVNSRTRTPKAAPYITISFNAPTEYVDGTPIASGTAITYDVYQGVNGATKEKIATITGTSGTITQGLVPGSEYCYHVIAIIAAKASDPSNEDCAVVSTQTPQSVLITVQGGGARKSRKVLR